MTYEDLLAKIKREEDYLKTQMFDGNAIGGFVVTSAIRAVVELHKPERGVIESWFKWLNGTKIIGCRLCEELYPCPTIQTIEKELNNG